MRIYFRVFLLFQLGINFSVSAQNCIEPDSFFRKYSQKIYCLDEVLGATERIDALCIKSEDLVSPLYGSLCLLDSIFLHSPDSFKEKVKSLKSLYVYGYLPPNLIELLKEAQAPINAIMLRPPNQGYKVHDFQSICLLKQFHDLSYIECADTSARLVECIQQFDQLDTLVWLNIYGQNPYLDRLMNITTLILHQYTGFTSHNTVSNWNFWSDSILFNFPAQLQGFCTKELSYSIFGEKVRRQCNKLGSLIDKSGDILSNDSLVLESEHFPPPMSSLKKLTFTHRIYGGESRARFIREFRIPSYIEQFSSLKVLEIITGHKLIIPTSFYTLSTLEELKMMDIETLSDSIRYLQKLKKLSLYNYSLEGIYTISDSISCLGNLEKLVLYNRLQREAAFMPNAIYGLSSLNELEVTPYLLSDSICYLSELTKLTTKGTIESDDLTSFPDSISCLKKLRYLEVGMQYRLDKFPEQIYKLNQLEQLVFRGQIKNPLLDAKKLIEMKNLKYLECNISLIKNEVHFRRVYEALPEHAILKLHSENYKVPKTWGNVGLYTDYGWGQTIFTGVEFLHYISHLSSQKRRDVYVESMEQKVTLTNMKIPPSFDFHTLAFGVEWNYSKQPNFLMGYRIGYNYSRIRTPLSFQVDLIGYTNYENVFDVRIAPRVAVPIKTDVVIIYLHYSYKLPLIASQEQILVARHSIGVNFRFTTDWWTSLPLGGTYGF